MHDRLKWWLVLNLIECIDIKYPHKYVLLPKFFEAYNHNWSRRPVKIKRLFDCSTIQGGVECLLSYIWKKKQITSDFTHISFSLPYFSSPLVSNIDNFIISVYIYILTHIWWWLIFKKFMKWIHNNVTSYHNPLIEIMSSIKELFFIFLTYDRSVQIY